jgi:antimicrobial peptide system SdpB family protein
LDTRKRVFIYDTSHLSIFGLFHDHLGVAKGLAILILSLVLIGWRPRWLCIPHWWVAWSLTLNTTSLEGGDQINANLCLLLIPILLLDGRHWHWGRPLGPPENWVKAVVSNSFLHLLWLQMALVYFHAFIAKLAVQEWANGTAIFYWFTHSIHGAPFWLRTWLYGVLSHPPMVLFFTWGTLLLECLLFMAIFNDRHSLACRILFYTAMAFHAGIIVVHGLGIFFFSMAGGLILYLYPLDKHPAPQAPEPPTNPYRETRDFKPLRELAAHG